MADPGHLERLTKEAADQGKLIEAGWLALRIGLIPNAPASMIDGMRVAYMAGAQHVFASMMTMMDAGDEATEADMRRMDLIAAELNQFAKELKLRATRAKGSG